MTREERHAATKSALPDLLRFVEQSKAHDVVVVRYIEIDGVMQWKHPTLRK